MYAIAFDLDTAQLQEQYTGNTWQNSYGDIRKALEKLGFTWTQGSVYFGNEHINPVKCVMAAQHLSKTFPWFAGCVKDMRMLRIEENNDLMEAL